MPKEESEQDLDKKYFRAYKNLNQSTSTAHTGSSSKAASQQKERGSAIVSKTKTASILKPQSSTRQMRASTATTTSTSGHAETIPLVEKQESVSSATRSDKGSVKSQVLIMSPTESQARHRGSVR